MYPACNKKFSTGFRDISIFQITTMKIFNKFLGNKTVDTDSRSVQMLKPLFFPKLFLVESVIIQLWYLEAILILINCVSE